MCDNDEYQSQHVAARTMRRTYLVTYSQADLQKFPTRESFATAVCNCFDEGSSKVKVNYWVCSLEPHENTSGFHYHVALKLTGPKRWNAVKQKLQQNHGIVVHFSSTHNMYYDAFKYVTKSDREYVKSEDHPLLEDIGSPRTAEGVKQFRKRSRPSASASTSTNDKEERPPKRKPERLQNLDVAELITNENLRDSEDLFVIANQRLTEGKRDLARFCVNKNRKSIEELFDSAWRLHDAEETVARKVTSRMDVIRTAFRTQCVDGCDRQWLKCAREVLEANLIHVGGFAQAVRELLIKGRGKKRNLILVGPANCGKTFLFAPLQKLFKTFSNPAHDKYTWQETENCDVIFLNDFRWSAEIIPWNDLLLLLEGQPVRFPAPKNHRAKDVLLERDVPVFATSKSEIKHVGKYNKECETETEMMSVRWKVFQFHKQIPMSETKDIVPCPRCFSNLVLFGERNV